MEANQVATLALRFLLELCALGALAYWGFSTGDSLLMKILLGLGSPLLAAVLWGLFVAPKAAVSVPAPVHFAPQVLVFGAAVAALVFAGQAMLGWIFAVVVVLNAILMYVWKQ